MISFIILWLALIVVCAIVGVNILQLLRASQFDRSGDRFIVSVWLGIAVLSLLFLTASLVVALTALVGAMLVAGLVSISLLRRDTRREVRTFSAAFSLRLILGALVLALGVAVYTTQPIRYYDTGLYHFGAIRWLSRFGAVPGLALLHFRFGLASAWFALGAPFNAGFLEARTTALLAGLALFLAGFHFLLCLSRCLKDRARLSDWFMVSASLFFLPTAIYWIMFVSGAPDVSVMLLAVVAAWVITIISENPRPENNGFAPNASIIPFVLSASALANKLSALALFIVCGLFYLYRNRFNLRSTVPFILVALAFVAPIIAYQVVVSGCPLLPMGPCLNVPTSIGSEAARNMTRAITLWSRWGGQPPPDAGTFNWVWRDWLKSGTTYKAVLAVFLSTAVAGAGFLLARFGSPLALIGRWLAALGITGAASLLMFRATSLLFIYTIILSLVMYKRRFEGKNWLLGLGLFGVGLAFYGAPSLRYNLGYLAVLSACIILSFRELLRGAMHSVSKVLRISKPASILPIMLIAGGLSIGFCRIALKNRPHTSGPFATTEEKGLSLFLPPHLPTAVVVPRRVNELDYYVPVSGDQCWAAELPCAPGSISTDVTLRDPARGIAAGFKHCSSVIHSIQTTSSAPP